MRYLIGNVPDNGEYYNQEINEFVPKNSRKVKNKPVVNFKPTKYKTQKEAKKVIVDRLNCEFAVYRENGESIDRINREIQNIRIKGNPHIRK